MRRGRSGPAVYGQLGALLVLACLGFWKDVYGKVVGAGEVGKQPGVGQGHLDRALVQANIQPKCTVQLHCQVVGGSSAPVTCGVVDGR